MCVSVSECLSVRPAFCLTPTSLPMVAEVERRGLPAGGWECVSNHRVHRLPVTLPYASEAAALIMPACDSHTAKVVRSETGSGG